MVPLLALVLTILLVGCGSQHQRDQAAWQDVVDERLAEAQRYTPPVQQNWFTTCPVAVDLLDEINTYRESQQLVALRPDPALTRAAMNHAEDMASRNYLAHTSPEGTTFSKRAHNAGYQRWASAEILSQANTAELAVMLWQQSHHHKATLDRTDSYFIGVGCAEVKSGLYNWVAVLGR